MYLAEHFTVQFRLQILVAPHWLEAAWPCCQQIARHPLSVSHQKYHVRDVLVGWVLKVCLHYINPLAVHRQVLYRQGFSSSIFQAAVGVTQVSSTKVY